MAVPLQHTEGDVGYMEEVVGIVGGCFDRCHQTGSFLTSSESKNANTP